MPQTILDTLAREVPPALVGYSFLLKDCLQMIIRYFDALAGAGKTRALALYADRLARHGYKVLFVQPTMHLIDKTIEEELRPLTPEYPFKAIHSGTIRQTESVMGD